MDKISGKIFVVATPIGNLEDITLRAIRIFKEVDVVLCEDTRVTAKLLNHLEIKKPLIRYDAHSTPATLEKIFEMLGEGKGLALVSDAGTPGISDPGSHLVGHVREHFKDKVQIVSVPGASALTASLSISGIPVSDFVFLGFLPHKKGRETLFKEIVASERTVVFYESPHRIEKTLLKLSEILDEKRQVVIAREITKMFEEVVSGMATEVKEYFVAHQDKVKGEFVVIVSGIS